MCVKNTHFKCLKSYYRDSRVEVTHLFLECSDVLSATKPIYEDLSKDALLQQCLGGFTQKNNESLNELIWKMSPKSVSGTAVLVEFTANVAACIFNEGCFALLIMMEEMQIKSGPSVHAWVRSVDNLRISRANEQAEKETKEGRVRWRQKQKDALDILNESIIHEVILSSIF